MIVTVIPNRSPDPTTPILALVDGTPAWFPRGVTYPVGTKVDVMITRAIHPVSRATQQPMVDAIRAFHIREIQPSDIKCSYAGFLQGQLEPYSQGVVNGSAALVYPGNMSLYIANPKVDEKLRPGECWVEHRGKSTDGTYTVVGLPVFDEFAAYVWAGDDA